MLIQAKEDCSGLADVYYDSPYFNPSYSYLYLKLEEALINDQKSLDILRPGFTSMGELSVVEFDMQLEVVNGTNDTCDGNQSYVKTFCTNSTDYSMWKLCDQHVLDNMTFSEQSLKDIQSKNDNDRISRHIIWLSLVHGSITSAFSIVNIINDEFSQFNWPGDIPLTLRINELKCNPSLLLTKCVLSELFSWVGTLTILYASVVFA